MVCGLVYLRFVSGAVVFNPDYTVEFAWGPENKMKTLGTWPSPT